MSWVTRRCIVVKMRIASAGFLGAVPGGRLLLGPSARWRISISAADDAGRSPTHRAHFDRCVHCKANYLLSREALRSCAVESGRSAAWVIGVAPTPAAIGRSLVNAVGPLQQCARRRRGDFAEARVGRQPDLSSLGLPLMSVNNRRCSSTKCLFSATRSWMQAQQLHAIRWFQNAPRLKGTRKKFSGRVLRKSRRDLILAFRFHVGQASRETEAEFRTPSGPPSETACGPNGGPTYGPACEPPPDPLFRAPPGAPGGGPAVPSMCCHLANRESDCGFHLLA